jgi:hypothetical protein
MYSSARGGMDVDVDLGAKSDVMATLDVSTLGTRLL